MGIGLLTYEVMTSWTKNMKYVVIYEKTSTGYSCYAPDLPGGIAAGDDLHETKELMERAVEIQLAGMREDGDPIPVPDCGGISRSRGEVKGC
jgi:predicted RNase H-like HicB family nuclease